ncbi:hypothetical protein ACFPES_02415 [Paenibacillus sp. GCM10023248]|uniref:hypothetical protein n=1 Tax=unclassified Paenibacillus TaxID=185978 RepID=UPI002378F57E|nr:hypothetical protein [Paenibacillus sp. MAHUQ-63]MDD9265878.1 hypothetical protein [Paenibacillus sp. MAHUQ-63]
MTAISPPIFGCPASSRKGDSPLPSSLYVGSLPAKSRLTVHFRIRVSNAGNLSADSVTVQNWISPLTTLLPGTLRIGDVPVNLTAPVTQPLVLWAVPLNGSTEITYTEAVVSRPNTRRIPLRSAAQYAYQVNDPVHTGTVLSNEAMIWVEQADE